MVFGIRTGKASGFGEVYTKHVKLNIVEGASADTQHSYSDEEKFSFAEHINSVLAEDKWLRENILPINPDNMKLFSDCRDGVMLWYVQYECRAHLQQVDQLGSSRHY